MEGEATKRVHTIPVYRHQPFLDSGNGREHGAHVGLGELGEYKPALEWLWGHQESLPE